jgi:disulfide bond formation protein DsbB
MTRERFRFGAVLFNLIAEIIGGVLVFGFAPQIIFADIGGDDLARLCLRLAVYSNAGMILVVALVLRYAPQPRLLRWLAAGGALYISLPGQTLCVRHWGLRVLPLSNLSLVRRFSIV